MKKKSSLAKLLLAWFEDIPGHSGVSKDNEESLDSPILSYEMGVRGSPPSPT